MPAGAIPSGAMDTGKALGMRHDTDAVLEPARGVTTRIPEQESGTRRLLNDYRNSPLRN